MDGLAEQEMMITMMQNMFFKCNDLVIDKKHKGDTLSVKEADQLRNCYIKYLKAPEPVMEGIQNLQSSMGNQFWIEQNVPRITRF